MSSHGGEILVVDDDPLSRKLLRRALEDAGYATRECDSGECALRVARNEPPALLLLDFEMPGMDGADVLRELRADEDPDIAQIPAIMLTGHSGVESEVHCLEAGANDFVTKPINAAVLRARIETQLRLRSLNLQLLKQNEELEAWRENLERDLAAARLTQQSLIPHKPPHLDGWDISACFRPVIEVGGDIYGWVRMEDQRLLFWIADATGHGASAALLTTLTKLLFHYGATRNTSPAAVMRAVNNEFRGIFGGRSFMTAMCLALDTATGKVVCVGAGHPPLLIVRSGGSHELVASTTPPVGLIELPQFDEAEIHLERGDSFILYTDGLFGGGEGKGARLTPESLAKLVDHRAPTAEALLWNLISQVAPHSESQRLADDLAAVAVRRLG